jgi:hypothetical protein
VNNERKCSNGTSELEVKDKMYYGPDQIAHGFRENFLEFSTPNKNNNYDEQYHVLCRNEVQHIVDIVKNQETPIITVEELKKAMDVLNKAKSPDIFGITIEHLCNADEVILDFLLHIYSTMLNNGEVPNVIKKGLLSPVIKKKGSKKLANYYRGITVLPVLNKILEAIIKLRMQPQIMKMQNPC